jgi:hypothetical protein
MGLLISWNAPATNNPIFAEIVPERLRTSIYAFDRCFEVSSGLAISCRSVTVQRPGWHEPCTEAFAILLRLLWVRVRSWREGIQEAGRSSRSLAKPTQTGASVQIFISEKQDRSLLALSLESTLKKVQKLVGKETCPSLSGLFFSEVGLLQPESLRGRPSLSM